MQFVHFVLHLKAVKMFSYIFLGELKKLLFVISF